MVNEDDVPVAGISKLAIVLLPFGGVELPIAVVSVPPLILKVIVLVEVAVEGANLAAILQAPPSMVNVQPLAKVSELLEVPILYVPLLILSMPVKVGEPFWAVTVMLLLLIHKPVLAAIE